MSILNTSNVNFNWCDYQSQTKDEDIDIIGMPTKKKFSKRKLTKSIWLMVSKRKYENHINVAGVVTRLRIHGSMDPDGLIQPGYDVT